MTTRVIVNRLQGSDTKVPGVWCIGDRWFHGANYVAEVATMNDAAANKTEVPVLSIGQNRDSGLYFAAIDRRFLNHLGFQAVWPNWQGLECRIELQTMHDEPGRWQGSVSMGMESLFSVSGKQSEAACRVLLDQYVDRVGLKVEGGTA